MSEKEQMQVLAICAQVSYIMNVKLFSRCWLIFLNFSIVTQPMETKTFASSIQRTPLFVMELPPSQMLVVNVRMDALT